MGIRSIRELWYSIPSLSLLSRLFFLFLLFSLFFLFSFSFLFPSLSVQIRSKLQFMITHGESSSYSTAVDNPPAKKVLACISLVNKKWISNGGIALELVHGLIRRTCSQNHVRTYFTVLVTPNIRGDILIAFLPSRAPISMGFFGRVRVLYIVPLYHAIRTGVGRISRKLNIIYTESCLKWDSTTHYLDLAVFMWKR